MAKRRAIDLVRRETTRQQKYRELAEEAGVPSDHPMIDDLADDRIEDDLLRLVFICCHPVLSRESRVALSLRLLGGLSTREIARAQLIGSATAGQRISRAKRTITDTGIAFEDPTRAERARRLPSVLEVVYLIFNEGYAASSGDDWVRVDLAGEGLRLGRVLAHLMPRVAEVHGLLSLMELQASRFGARQGPTGPILLEDQDRLLWDRLLIRRGLESLERAMALGGGPYTAQAEIAAVHSRAATAEQTDWRGLANLYDGYVAAYPGPVAELNRGIAHWKAYGTAAARAILDPLLDDPRVGEHHLLHAALAELDLADGNADGARQHLLRARVATASAADRAVLDAKLARIGGGSDTSGPTTSTRP